MKMPKKISTLLMVIYFLLLGVGHFVGDVNIPIVMALLAIGIAVTLFLDR